MNIIKGCKCLDDTTEICPKHKLPTQQILIQRQLVQDKRRAEIEAMSDEDLRDLLTVIQGSF